jgi:RHS repeat-associated protein
VNSSAYDNSGNQTTIGGYSYAYDAENRMVGAYLYAGATVQSNTAYVYDGMGRRVQKINCGYGSTPPCTAANSYGMITTYVYDAFGNLAAEYGAASSLMNFCGTPTCYLTQDQIGSTRLVTDANGLVGTRYDYLPFGEEVPAGTGNRTTAMGYNLGEDYSNPKFAGQMRDPESARDYMGFRYYSPSEGRFVSVDPGNAGADATDPQTWNGYAYVVNIPLTFTDPSGRCWWCTLLGIGLDIAGIFTGGATTLLGTAVEAGSTAATVSDILLTAGSAVMLGGEIAGSSSGSPNSSLGVPSTTGSAGNSFLGLSCLDSATQDLLEKALIGAASAALGVKVSRGQGPLVVQGGAMNVPLNVPAGVSPEVIANAGYTNPIFEPDFNREIRINKRVPGPGKSVHVMFNTGGSGQSAITTARVHADIGNPEDVVGALGHLFGDVLAATMASKRHGVCAVKFN